MLTPVEDSSEAPSRASPFAGPAARAIPVRRANTQYRYRRAASDSPVRRPNFAANPRQLQMNTSPKWGPAEAGGKVTTRRAANLPRHRLDDSAHDGQCHEVAAMWAT